MTSEAGTYYRCTACWECFFTNEAFLTHALSVHCKVLVNQGHDPTESTQEDAFEQNLHPVVKSEPPDDRYENIENFLHGSVQSEEDDDVAMTEIFNETWTKVEQCDSYGKGAPSGASPAYLLKSSGEQATYTSSSSRSSYHSQVFAGEDAAGREQALYDHAKMHVETYICTDCTKAFSSLALLESHSKIHKQDRTFKCHLCPAAFARQRNLRIHMRVHMSEKPFGCTQCPACFKQSTDLKRHMRTHTGEKPYACTICTAAFAQPIDLKRHIRAHTGEKPYKCDVCDAAYTRRHSLNDHKRLHTGEKPFQCSHCRKTFVRQSKLKVHLRTHSEVPP